jgi:hypothetical protein
VAAQLPRKYSWRAIPKFWLCEMAVSHNQVFLKQSGLSNKHWGLISIRLHFVPNCYSFSYIKFSDKAIFCKRKKHSESTERCQEIHQDLNKEENVCKSHLDRSNIFSILTSGGTFVEWLLKDKDCAKKPISN